MNTKDYNYTIKAVIVGEYGVGKSSILSRYCDNIYNDNYLCTIGADFYRKIIDLNGYQIKMHLWDTAGQEKYQALTPSYFRGAYVILLVFDLTNLASFKKLGKWMREVNGYKVVLIGNKSDLKNREVPQSYINEFISEYKVSYFETSARKDNNIVNLFSSIVSEFLTEIEDYKTPKEVAIDETCSFCY